MVYIYILELENNISTIKKMINGSTNKCYASKHINGRSLR